MRLENQVCIMFTFQGWPGGVFMADRVNLLPGINLICLVGTRRIEEPI